jgi:hypothetical protein
VFAKCSRRGDDLAPETVEADVIPESMGRGELQKLLRVGRTRLHQLINVLIEVEPGFQYSPYDRHFRPDHYFQLRQLIDLQERYGKAEAVRRIQRSGKEVKHGRH